MTANAMLMFTQLYRVSVAARIHHISECIHVFQEACVKVSGLLRDACHFLSMSDMFRDVSSQFVDALDVLMKIGDCPFMFVTAQLVRTELASPF